MTGIAVTTWPANGQDRIDLFWRDNFLVFRHIGGDGQRWSSNRIGPLGSVVPESPDDLGGIWTTVPTVVTSLVRAPTPINPAAPVPAHQPAAHPSIADLPAAGPAMSAPAETNAGHTAASAAADAPVAAGAHTPVVQPPLVMAHRMDVFGLGLDFAMYHQVVWNGLPENPQPLDGSWERLGGDFISAPAAIAWNDGHNKNRIDVFAVNAADRSMWQRTWDGNKWAGDWQSLGGIFTSAASVVSWGPGRLDLFARGSDFTLRHRAFQDGAWLTDWQNLGGSLASQPVAVSRGPNILDVISVDHEDGSVLHRWWDGNLWNDWEKTSVPDPKPGFGFVATPSVVASNPDRIDLVTSGNDGVGYHFWWEAGAFRLPLKVGANTTATLARLPSGGLRLFGGTTEGLLAARFDGTKWLADSLNTGFGPAIEASVSRPSRYRYEIVNVRASTTRALFEDTDVGNASVTPGNWPATMKTDVFQADIIDGSNYQPVNDGHDLVFDEVVVELCEHAMFSYTIVNKSDARTVDFVDTEFSFNKVASIVANDALKSIGKQLTNGVNDISEVEIAALTVPVTGTILGILAGWLMNELSSILKSGHCDGPVAAEQFVTTGRELYQKTLHGPLEVTTHHPGQDSNIACGPNSAYDITWQITQLK